MSEIPPGKPPLELALAQEANAAIKSGADANAVTEKLHQVIGHLRANPDLAKQGQEALDAGIDASTIARKTFEHSLTNPTPAAPVVPTSYRGTPEKAGDVQKFIDGATLGFGTKGMAGVDALLDAANTKVHGGSFGGTLGPAYEQNLTARNDALKQFDTAHPIESKIAGVTGAIAPVIATLGAGAGAEAATKAPLIARMVKAIPAGLGWGAANSIGHARGGVEDYAKRVVSDAPLSAAGGFLAPAAGDLVGAGARAVGLPRLASATAQSIASAYPESKIGRVMAQFAGATGTRGEAAEELGRRIEQDKAAGIDLKPPTPGVPSMAIDAGGPAVQGLAENIANAPTAGRSILTKKLTDRAQQMRPNVSAALAEGTGVPAGQGLNPLQEAIDKMRAAGNQAYDAARTATEGQPISAPTLDKIIGTKTGRDAYRWAMARKGELVPDITESEVIPPGFSPEQWQQVKARMEQRGMPVPEIVGSGQPVPDPEVLHLMKRYLAYKAKLGVPGVEGKEAADAAGAMALWGKVRSELPEIWQKADDIYAQHAQALGLMNQGRNVFSTRVNPPVKNARKAIDASLGAFGDRVANATPEGQAAAQTGAATAAHSLLESAPNNLKAPGRIFAKSPERVQQTGFAFPTPDAAQDFQNKVGAWDAIANLNQKVLGGSPTAPRMAEEASRQAPSGNALLSAAGGNFGTALKQVLQKFGNSASSAQRNRVDTELASRLTAPDMKALIDAIAAMQSRRAIRGSVQRALPAVGGLAASGTPQ